MRQVNLKFNKYCGQLWNIFDLGVVEFMRIQENNVNEFCFWLCLFFKGFDFDLSYDSDEDSLVGDGENDEVKIVEEVDNGMIKVVGYMLCDYDENEEDDGSGDDCNVGSDSRNFF